MPIAECSWSMQLVIFIQFISLKARLHENHMQLDEGKVVLT